MRRHWRVPVAYLTALFAAAILIVAAFFKAGDPGMFAEQITAYQVTPASWSPMLAYIFIALELVMGAALIAFVCPRLLLTGTILLMLGFIGVTAWAWAHGDLAGCGCFGRLVDRGPRETIIEDAIVIATSLLGLWLVRGFRVRPWQWTAFAILMVPVIVLVGFGTALPLDGVVVGIGPGTDLSEMSIEGLPQPLEDGRVLLALVGEPCPACDEGMADLKAIAAEQLVPRVLGVYAGRAGAAQAWRLRHLPNFPLRTSPERVLRQYYRGLPVTFLLENGIVRTVWWNRIPTPDDVRAVL